MILSSPLLLDVLTAASRFQNILFSAPSRFLWHTTDVVDVCEQIEKVISSESDLYWPRETILNSFRELYLNFRSVELDYLEDISHYASSSTQYSACSVEPGTAVDVGEIVRASTNTVLRLR